MFILTFHGGTVWAGVQGLGEVGGRAAAAQAVVASRDGEHLTVVLFSLDHCLTRYL